MADFGITSTQLALLAALVVVIAFTLANARRKVRQRGPSPSEYAREQIARLKDQQGVKGDLEQLLVEVHEAARRLNAQMDTKAARLEALIRDADERLTRLQRTAHVTAPDQEPNAPQSSQESARLDVLVGDGAPPDEDRQETDPVRLRILELAREGRGPVQIAQDTGVPPGEVELILALHASINASAPPPQA